MFKWFWTIFSFGASVFYLPERESGAVVMISFHTGLERCLEKISSYMFALNCIWMIFEILYLAPFYYALFSFAFFTNTETGPRLGILMLTSLWTWSFTYEQQECL